MRLSTRGSAPAAVLALAVAATGVAAQAPIPPCDQKEASARWESAMEARLIQGVGMLNGEPTIQVARRDWANYPLVVRLGFIATLDCVAGGGETFFSRIQFVDEGGRVLARWDGIRRSLDVIE